MSSERAESESNQPAGGLSGETRIIWVLWLTYGAFYFCRTNISAAVPGLKASVDEGGLGLTPGQVGLILGSLKVAYGLGQLVNGQMSERFSPRRLLAIGMLGSAALNVMFGLGAAFYFLLFVWACNGYCQSLGWTPCVRVAVNWIPIELRGKAIGLIGTGYQVTLGLTFLVAGGAAEWLGWQGALFIPAILLVLTSLFMLLFLEESPPKQEASVDTWAESKSGPEVEERGTFVDNLLITLGNGKLWLLGVSLGLLNACRYGFLDWGLTHLTEVQDSSVGRAALKYTILPLGAVAGSYLAGWATDRFFGSRRAPVICILLVLLGILSLAYDSVARTSTVGVLLLLMAIGFCIYGPQVLLVGTAPADLARRGTSAAAAGFVNFLGYMGAFAGDVVTGTVLERFGWETAINIWAGWAFGAAVAAALLWNATAKKSEPAEPETKSPPEE